MSEGFEEAQTSEDKTDTREDARPTLAIDETPDAREAIRGLISEFNREEKTAESPEFVLLENMATPTSVQAEHFTCTDGLEQETDNDARLKAWRFRKYIQKHSTSM